MSYPTHTYDEGMETVRHKGTESYRHRSVEGTENLEMAADDDKRGIYSSAHIYDEEDRGTRLNRDLKTRQISMIALGGALGTGLLINTGPNLSDAGPGSMLIGYALVGILCFTVMSAMGEMAAWLPLPSGFTGFAHRFVDPALGFALGWNYWFKYIITTPNNIIASILVIQYWFNQADYTGPASSTVIYVALILVFIVTINYFGVGIFGEFEFWFSSIKVLILVALMIFTLCVAAGVGNDPHPTGFKYWREPGAFAEYHGHGAAGRFLGFWNVLQSAVFSYLGAELVGVTVGEASNPRRAIPRAVKLTFFRIVFFYLALILFLGMTVPYNDPRLLRANKEVKQNVSADSSPFMVAANIAGYSGLANVLNAFLLIFALSAANSDLYIATRTLYALSIEGNAPKIFSHTDSRGVPVYALSLSSAFCCMAFIAHKVGVFYTFSYFITLVTIFGILTWISILISHISFIRARKAQGVPDDDLAYVSPFGALGSMIALGFACLITFFSGWVAFTKKPYDWKVFLVSYMPILIYVGMILGYKVVMRSTRVVPLEADLFGGKKRIDDDEREYLAEEASRLRVQDERVYVKVYRATSGYLF